MKYPSTQQDDSALATGMVAKIVRGRARKEWAAGSIKRSSLRARIVSVILYLWLLCQLAAQTGALE